VKSKSLAIYQEVIDSKSRWKSGIKRSFTIPRELNSDMIREDMDPYILFRNVTFAYHNEAIQIRVEKDEFGADMFLLTFHNKIIGYFEPSTTNH